MAVADRGGGRLLPGLLPTRHRADLRRLGPHAALVRARGTGQPNRAQLLRGDPGHRHRRQPGSLIRDRENAVKSRLDAEGISFVIPCLNSGGYLLEAVESLIQQPHTFPYEVVIVDDGSDDQPTLRAIALCAERAEVRIVRQEHSGHHAARNAGINAASFEYVMQLDADDRLATAPELLKAGSYPDRAVKLLKTHQHVAFVHTMSRMIGDFDGLTISSYPCREELVLRKHHVPLDRLPPRRRHPRRSLRPGRTEVGGLGVRREPPRRTIPQRQGQPHRVHRRPATRIPGPLAHTTGLQRRDLRVRHDPAGGGEEPRPVPASLPPRWRG
ncbi:glycosyltransferase family 2 protein [Streptomyces sp. T1317-0309]|nr:glycosyltransferase family 2 protein [Streptomyces sp. T1317-0309]